MLHLVIYEDDKDVREGLYQLLTATNEIIVECMFGNCDTIETDLQNLHADAVLMDIGMPGTNGIEGVRRAKAVKPGMYILMLTVFDDDKKYLRQFVPALTDTY